MNRIVLNEEDFRELVRNDYNFNGLYFNKSNILDLITGEIVEIEDNMIILSDIGANRIFDILSNK